MEKAMSEEEKVEVLREQLERIRFPESNSEELKKTIRKLGYCPDRRTW